MAIRPAMTSKMPTIAMRATPNQIQPTIALTAGLGSGLWMTCGGGSWVGAWSGRSVPRCDVVGIGRLLLSGRAGEFGGEELGRGRRLGLLLAGEVDATVGEERLRPGCHFDRVLGCALGGELEDARAVRVEPRLGDHAAPEFLR